MKSLKEIRKTNIENEALEIRKKYNLDISFDLIEFLTNYKGYEIQLQQIDDETTGLLFINEIETVERSEAHNVIVINANLIEDRLFEQKRRFICAHEYGHAVLHKGEATVFARRDTMENKSDEELEAEYFAYCFLLPKYAIKMLMDSDHFKHLIDKMRKEFNISCAEVIALLFNVTPKKATERLKQLGYNNV